MTGPGEYDPTMTPARRSLRIEPSPNFFETATVIETVISKNSVEKSRASKLIISSLNCVHNGVS